MTEQRLFVADVSSTLAEWRLLFNDRIVSRGRTTDRGRRAVVVNAAVQSGLNTMRFQVARRDEANGVMVTVTAPTTLELLVREGWRGKVPEPEGVRARWELIEPLRAPVADGWVTVWSGEFETAVPWRCTWQGAEGRSPDAACEALLRQYEQALASRDVQAVLRLRSTQLNDMKAALALGDDDIAAPFGDALRQWFADPR